MPVYIQNIATAVPEHFYKQDFLRERMKEYLSEDKATRRIIHSIYSRSGIDKRHSVINDFRSNGNARFYFQQDGSLSSPSTGKRNELYAEYAKPLYVEVARKLVTQNKKVSTDDITHVITVSCTGFFAPEPAYEIVKQLGLSPATQRYHLGFMGCFAAFPALKMARSFCEAQPDAKVMVVCLELCSLHFQDSEQTDNLISGSVFADGAAGTIVSSDRPIQNSYRLDGFATTIAEQSENDMAWTIGDTGFDMVLSTYVPDIIEANLLDSLQPLLNAYKKEIPEINHWAIHPGGRSILDKIESTLSLEHGHLEASRKVLAEYGNMSSATILFVLQELLKKENKNGNDGGEETTLAMAFGPGLTIESCLLTKQSP